MSASDPAHVHHDSGCSCGNQHAGPTSSTALISVRGLCFEVGGQALLTSVDIDIFPGEIVTLIGPNGAGKTTLVKLVLGIETPSAGVVHRRPELNIGYVPQRFEIDRSIPMSVERFLSLGTDAAQRSLYEALKDAGVEAVAQRQLSALSGGEIQRVLLARALLRRPDLLVLDEPVRGVDHVGEAELYDLIGRIRDDRGCGILLVSHDLHIVMAKSDRVICLNRHVCCSGKPEAVARNSEYASLFGRETAPAFGIYTHHHDHAHHLSGLAKPNSEEGS